MPASRFQQRCGHLDGLLAVRAGQRTGLLIALRPGELRLHADGAAVLVESVPGAGTHLFGVASRYVEPNEALALFGMRRLQANLGRLVSR